MLVSALDGHELHAAWDKMQTLADWRKTNGHWQRHRDAQTRHWFEHAVRRELLAQLADTRAQARMNELSDQVTRGELSESAAVRALLEVLKLR